MLKKILAFTLLISLQIKPTSETGKPAEPTKEDAEFLASEIPAEDTEVVRSRKLKKFKNILVSCGAKIKCLRVCGNACINGNLTVGGTITSANPVTIAAPVSIPAPVAIGGPLTIGSCTLNCVNGVLTTTSGISSGDSGTFAGTITIGSCTLTCTPAGLVVTTPAGTTTIGAAGAVSPFAMFFGLTAGTGMIGTDYASTVPVKTSAGTGRVPFPQNGPSLGPISRIDSSSFNLPNIGTYEVTFRVHTTEPGQLQLELNNVDLANTVAVNMNPTSGGHPIIGNAYITTTSVNSVLAVINPAGNSTALTITPANGAETHANAQSITIRQIA